MPTREAGISIQPGVERSGTPGNGPLKIGEARGAGDSRTITLNLIIAASVGRFAA